MGTSLALDFPDCRNTVYACTPFYRKRWFLERSFGDILTLPPLRPYCCAAPCRFEAIALAQVEELWTRFGALNEIW